MKKYVWIIVNIIIITLILIFINNIIFGTEKIGIADYMPNPNGNTELPWPIVKLTRTIKDMGIATMIGAVITATESLVLYKKQILKKDFKSLILVLIIFFIPVLIAGIKLSTIYGYTC